MSIMKNFYEQHNKPRKPRIKYVDFLVRDANNYNTIYFIVRLEDKKYWDQAREYMYKKREEDNCYENYADSEIMEEYWKNNNIPYRMIFLPDEELYL